MFDIKNVSEKLVGMYVYDGASTIELMSAVGEGGVSDLEYTVNRTPFWDSGSERLWCQHNRFFKHNSAYMV